MPVEVIDYIAPKNNGSFPTHDAAYGKGGYLTVADVTARNAISAARRSSGMRVRTTDTGLEWVLKSDLTTWVSAPSSTRQDIIDFVGDVVDLYVDSAGDDSNTGFSYGSAFLTIQAAVDAVPDNLWSIYGKRVRIHLGTGTFDRFFMPKKGVFIRIIGDRRSPLESWAALSKTFTVVSGYVNRERSAISAWVGTVNETTHWLESDWTDFDDGESDISGAAALDSTSPNLDVPGDGTFGYSVGIHPFLSIIDASADPFGGWTLVVDDSSKLDIVGVKLDSGNAWSFYNVMCHGCYFFNTIGGLNLYRRSFFSGVADSGSNTAGQLWLNDSSINYTVIKRRAIRARTGNTLVYGLTVKGSFTSSALEIETYCEIRNIDFETQRQGFSVSKGGILEMLNVDRGLRVQGTPTRILTVADGSLVKFPSSAGQKFTGAIAGVPVVITSGTVINAKACCSTYLTNSSTPASEITVGGNASVLFSALPTTDLALGNTSTVSRAT